MAALSAASQPCRGGASSPAIHAAHAGQAVPQARTSYRECGAGPLAAPIALWPACRAAGRRSLRTLQDVHRQRPAQRLRADSHLQCSAMATAVSSSRHQLRAGPLGGVTPGRQGGSTLRCSAGHARAPPWAPSRATHLGNATQVAQRHQQVAAALVQLHDRPGLEVLLQEPEAALDPLPGLQCRRGWALGRGAPACMQPPPSQALMAMSGGGSCSCMQPRA